MAHESNNPIFGTPIVKRLNQEQTLLRSSADASLLLQSLLDLGMYFLPQTLLIHLIPNSLM